MLNEKQIRNAAIELQDLLGCEPPLNSKADIPDLTPELRKAIKLLTPEDKLSKDTQQVVKELSATKPIGKGKAKEESEPEEEKQEEGDEDLISDINAAERIRDLKDIATEYDEFKSIRGKLSSYKTVEDLRDAMLSIVAIKMEEGEPEPVKETEEDPDPEEEVKPIAKEKKEKPAGDKPKRPAPPRKEGVGVIQTIVNAIEGAGKKGITKAGILEILIKNFPDKNEQSMKATINVQVPGRISKEKFPVKKLDGDKFAKA